jgi:hypothetical protein
MAGAMATRLSSRLARRSRIAWAAAWLAIALNVAAPVIAYATTLARIDAAAHGMHDHAAHDGHEGHRHGQDHGGGADSSPLVGHCQYCLDFAAGAPLALFVSPAAAACPASDEAPPARASPARASRCHGFACARGPPAARLLTA